MIPLNTIVFVKTPEERKEIHEWAYGNRLFSVSFSEDRFEEQRINLYACNSCDKVQQAKVRYSCCELCDRFWYQCNSCHFHEGWFEDDDIVKTVKGKNAILVSNKPIRMKHGYPISNYNILIN